MWRRLMRRTFAPRRPPLFMEQWALALVTVVLLGAGIALAIGLLR
ncbi:MAG: hypothetical protein ACJ76S_01110 [Solirubrobacteraceae bacterium]|jgi:hypothetical protein